MAAAAGVADDIGSISASQTTDALSRYLFGGSKTMLIYPRSIAASMLGPRIRSQFEGVLTAVPGPAPVAKSVKSSKSSSAAWNRSEVVDGVFDIVTSLLGSGHDTVDEDANLMDLGLDSLGATELAGNLSSRFGIRVMSTLIFNYPTLKDITEHMVDQLGVRDDARPVLTVIEEKVSASSEDKSAGLCDVAIVGASCRLPNDVNDLSAMWDMMSGGVDCTSEVQLSRWDVDGVMASSKLVDASFIDRDRNGRLLSE